MAFESFADFLAMGTHGPYVWAAYGLSIAIIVWNVLQPLLLRRRWLREQSAQLKRDARDVHKS
ncbi:MAG: heme exporter protein CcmD [Moraxellaceae bacterium]|nr:heme exporter protein CcmD [Moraxellaceae bacterium]